MFLYDQRKGYGLFMYMQQNHYTKLIYNSIKLMQRGCFIPYLCEKVCNYTRY